MGACAHCGRPLPPQGKFCTACGKPVLPTTSPPRTPASPGSQQGGSEPSPPPSDHPHRSVQELTGQALQAMKQFRGRLMSPQEFMNMARQVPWRNRPQSWWDLLSIFGGAGIGVLWFLYSSVRATRLGWGFTLILLVPLLVVVVFRRKAAEMLNPLWTKFQNLSVTAKVIAALAVVAVIMLLPKHEGFDLTTPFLLFAIPTVLVRFRKEVDRILAPLEPMRAALPLAVRVGIGLAIPFATAFFLYNGLGVRMFPLMRCNVVLGTLLSYAVIRTPPSEGSPSRGNPGLSNTALFLFLAGLSLFWAFPSLADDFLRDPFNLNDGLRTDGIAPAIAGVSTAVVTMLVNGVEVARTVIQAANPPKEGEQEERKNFQVIVNTTDKTGAPSTTVKAETGGVLIYAHCEQAGGRFPAGDPTITFSLLSGKSWVTLADLGMRNGERCAHVTLSDPRPESGNPPKTCSVHVSAGAGALVETTIELELEDELELLVEILE